MPERLANGIIDIEKRKALLHALPAFAMLSDEECAELVAYMYEVQYAPGQILVKENDLIDSVFILTCGSAEVSRDEQKRNKISKKVKSIKVPVAIIGPGDSVGLNTTGFFSLSGKRTATVTALTLVNALILDLNHLHAFLGLHPNLQTAMYAAAGQMLRVRLIRQSLPFSRLSHERLLWLANQVEEIILPAGTEIFKQGEMGNRCYLIRSGEVEILSQSEEGTEQRLALLKTPTLFGEATLITHSPRNATARTLTECDLLVLRHDYLSELIETEQNVADMFMTLMVDRSRPLQNPHVMAHHRITADEQPVVILKNPDNGLYFKLSAEGWFIWEQLDGTQTLRAITMALTEKFKIFAPDVVAGLISKLAKATFISNVEINNDAHITNKPLWTRVLLQIRRLLEMRVAIGDADKWLTSIYKKGAYLLFTPLGAILLSLIAVSGFFALGFATHNVINIFKTIHDSWILFLFLIPATIVSVALHEMGHALTTKSFGYEVHYMGVGWNWVGPVAFTDTSDMWLSTRGPRIVVNLAGCATDILVAGIASLLIFVFHNPYIQGFLWIFAVYTYLNAFRMLSPLQDLDGYYVLMDILEKPHLRQTAVIWLVEGLPKSIRNPKLLRQHIPEVVYWVSCIAFLILITLVTLSVQTFLFKIVGFKPTSHVVNFILPIMVTLISSLGIIADIRAHKED